MSDRFPLGPIEAICLAQSGLQKRVNVRSTQQGEFTTHVLAEMVGTAVRTIYRWRKTGLPLEAADRIATSLGRHGAEVWGYEQWTEGIDEEAHDYV